MRPREGHGQTANFGKNTFELLFPGEIRMGTFKLLSPGEIRLDIIYKSQLAKLNETISY
ncbi:hypothetical protein HanIR_Chr14g0675171 [Helianthus annuus]|nr:hypothetical protein HanIR_Chr14g0675171 [Helianthus annuus]